MAMTVMHKTTSDDSTDDSKLTGQAFYKFHPLQGVYGTSQAQAINMSKLQDGDIPVFYNTQIKSLNDDAMDNRNILKAIVKEALTELIAEGTLR